MKSKMSLFGMAAFLALPVFLLFSCSGKKEYEYRLTYSVFFPSVHVQSALADSWARKVEEESGGRLKIDVFAGGVLSGAAENYDCVANGVSDIGMSCLSYSRGLFPLSECLDFPLGYPNGKIATQVANDFLNKFQPKEFDETHMLYLHGHGPGVIAARKCIKNVGELKNMSIRGTGITAQIIKTLGGNAVGLPQGETFEALRKGVVEATLCPVETLKGWKQGEVIDYVIRIPAIGYTTAMFVTMNKKSWNKLPPDLQQIITRTSKDWIEKHGQAWDEADNAGNRFVESLNKEYYTFSDEENALVEKKLEPLIEEWIKRAEAKGLPGREAVGFIKERIAFYKAMELNKE